MKWYFIFLYRDAGAGETKGGFTTEEKAELKTALTEVQTALESKSKTFIDEALKTHLKTINEANDGFKKWQGEKDAADQKNQEAIDKLLTDIKELNQRGRADRKVKSLADALTEKFADKDVFNEIKAVKRGNPVNIKLDGAIDLSLKSVGNETLSSNLTGDSVATYNQRQAILPAQKVNFRDLIPSVHSDTGLYVTYKETGGEQTSTSWLQTEASAKNQVDFDFSEVQTVNKFIAGFVRFSRQISRSLPWMQTTLPRLLLRDFYKKENRYFYDVVATAATGSSTTTETDDVKQIIDWIANQNSSDFNASFGVLSPKALANLNKLLYTNGYYQGSGGVLSMPDGSIRIAGTPIIPATWVPSNDKILIMDTDYVERVEVEGVTVQFFEQDSDNVQKNLITARIECYEEINPMLPSSIIIGDFGNSSTS